MVQNFAMVRSSAPTPDVAEHSQKPVTIGFDRGSPLARF